ncbi:MAG: low molecular weight phosphotyrosine protein phosphatase [Anaerolineae bacterium]|nr:low molecular weight phosphotyrosine protein phosphatase [Anaerolineae bacterium]
MTNSINVLFVCSGNTCRSPMAEAAFHHLVQESGLESQITVRSAGAYAREGEQMTRSTRRVLAENGIDWPGQPARQLTASVASEADYILVMDRTHLAAVRRYVNGNGTGPTVRLLLDYAPQLGVQEVDDPFGTDAYDDTYALILPGVEGLLAHLREVHTL